VEFDPAKHLTCDDPTQVDGGRVLIVSNPELEVRNQQSVVPFSFPVDTEDDLPFGGRSLLQHVYGPLDDGEAPDVTPLFRDPNHIDAGSGRAAYPSYDDALRSLRLYIGAVMLSGDPTLYGFHSLRSGDRVGAVRAELPTTRAAQPRPLSYGYLRDLLQGQTRAARGMDLPPQQRRVRNSRGASVSVNGYV